MAKETMMRLLAIGLLVGNALVMVALWEWTWTDRDLGMKGNITSHGALAVSRCLGLFPFPVAVFMGVALLMAAAFVYPWPGRVADADGDRTLELNAEEPGVWPPPPVRPTKQRLSRTQHHWARPNPDED